MKNKLSNETMKEMNTNAMFNQRTYLMGDMIDPMSSISNKKQVEIASGHPLKVVFPLIEPYDGTSIDSPILVMGEYLKDMDNNSKNSLHKTYHNSKPIILINAEDKEINRFLEVIGLKKDYASPENLSHTEIFAVNCEKGFSFKFSMYPTTGANFDSLINANIESDPFSSTDALIKWLSDTGKRVNDQVLSDKKMLSDKVASNSTDLESLVVGYNSVHVFPGINRNTFQFSYWIYSLHDLNDLSDWFYIRQEGQLNAGTAYWPKEYKNWLGSGYDIKEWYIYSYLMNSFMPGLERDCVELFRSSPSTETTKTEVTSSVDWDFSGKVGFESVKPTGNVGVNLHLGNSSKVIIQDCQVINNSLDEGANAKWLYQFKEVKPIVYFGYVAFNDASPLQRGLFQPINQWLWKLSPKVRSSGVKSFKSTFERDRVSSKGDGWIAYFMGQATHKHEKFENKYEVQLPFPPVLMADKHIEFEKNGQTKYLDVAVGRDWTAFCEEPWCHIEISPEGGTAKNTRLHITVDNNETGKTRTAKITLNTLDLMGSSITEVFQSNF